jgi:hypothetical protein
MRSRPEPEDVFQDLGSKVCDGFSVAVERTRADLSEYRRRATRLAGRHSATGLANWLADQMMENLAEELNGVSGVDFVDGVGHTREILIEGASGCYYRFRAKRHHMDGAVSTYRTPGAIQFMTQEEDDLALFAYVELRLSVGYLWDADMQEVGEAVVSLRDDGGHRVIWMEEVPFSGVAAGAGTVTPFPTPTPTPIRPAMPSADESADGPDLPVIDLPSPNTSTAESGDEER